MESKNETFTYTYSAKDAEEVRAIRQKYAPKEADSTQDKMEQLRKLDKSVTKRGTILSAIVGTISALIFGIGMCCTMLWTNFSTVGIVVGLVGLVGIIAVYPLYNHVTKKDRDRIAPQILALSNELLQ